VEVPVRGIDAIVGGDPAACARACARLRAGGWRVQASATQEGDALAREAREAGAVYWMTGAADALTRVSDGATLLVEPLPAPPTAAAFAIGGSR
jgi:hypothetical protein